MYRKTCTRCNNTSYSSSKIKKWICPYCANEIIDGKIYRVNQQTNLKNSYRIYEQFRGRKIYSNR